MKRTITPQFDLPGAEGVFNLSGELLACPVSTAHHPPEAAPNLFGPCPRWRPYRRDNGTLTRRCADCGAMESEHEAKLQACGKRLFGMMPPCVLPTGHAGDCQDGFGGHYHYEPTRNQKGKNEKS